MLKRVVEDIDDTWFKRIALKADNEAALEALQRRVKAAYDVEVVPQHSVNRPSASNGMIEQTGSIYLECGHGNLHAPKGSHALIRRLNDFSLAKHGELGVIQLFSDIQKSYPGHSILTEDIGYTLPSKACVCGHEGVIVKVDGRLESAEVRGCSDAIFG